MVVGKKIAPIGSGNIMRCDFVGVGVASLEEECHSGGGQCSIAGRAGSLDSLQFGNVL